MPHSIFSQHLRGCLLRGCHRMGAERGAHCEKHAHAVGLFPLNLTNNTSDPSMIGAGAHLRGWLPRGCRRRAPGAAAGTQQSRRRRGASRPPVSGRPPAPSAGSRAAVLPGMLRVLPWPAGAIVFACESLLLYVRMSICFINSCCICFFFQVCRT